jgi:hypothetical protein
MERTQRMALLTPIRVVSKGQDHCQLIQGNVFLTYTTGPARDEHIGALVMGLDKFFGELPAAEKGAYVLITRGSARPPEGSARRKVQDAFNRHSRRLSAGAIVIETSGFTGAILRTVASTLFVLSQRGFPVKFFATRAECLPWISETTGQNSVQLAGLIEHAQMLVGA